MSDEFLPLTPSTGADAAVLVATADKVAVERDEKVR